MLEKKGRKAILFAFVLTAVVTGGIMYVSVPQSFSHQKTAFFSSAQKHYTIVLREDGFHPQELTITEGDTVTFRTIRGVSFWPASNLHPIHELYPAFDTRKAIPSNEAWSFQFDSTGTWPFHDHLFSPFLGIIHVLSRE